MNLKNMTKGLFKETTK